MKKFFNTTGPCHPSRHYMLPAQARCEGLPELIENGHYFVIHAARQSGKTTLLLDLVNQLNAVGDYYALYCSLESVQQIDDVERGIPSVLRELQAQIQFTPHLQNIPFMESTSAADFNTALRMSLSYFCQKLDKPLVILFDEIDCLQNGTLISFLRQLRLGYVNRYQIPFVHSVALVGMRNIRDYKVRVRDERDTLGTASPFNIVAEYLKLRNFSVQEVGELYAQHSAQGGQTFSPEFVADVYRYTQGQPWLVNAIAKEITAKILANDITHEPQPKQVASAAHNIIKRRDTHIDSLMERLKEARVQRVLEPIIAGELSGYDLLDDDYRYVLDLGLLREQHGKLIPANPIYEEVIIRALSFPSQNALDHLDSLRPPPAYLNDKRLDMRCLLADFQAFWRTHSEAWIARYQYQEAAPHLILHAFLYRVINGGGQISREMAAGNGRLDLCLHYQGIDYPVELKIRYSEDTYAEGLKQLAAYMDRLGCQQGWLVVFDRRKTVAWEEKLFWRSEMRDDKQLDIVGC